MKNNKVYILIEQWYRVINSVPTMFYSNTSNICYHTIDEAIADAKSIIKQCIEKGENDFNVVSETDYHAVYVQKDFDVAESYEGFRSIKRKLIVKELHFI